MHLQPGAVVGPYQITAHIGSGGMGDVYRARDPKLQRDVPSVLPEALPPIGSRGAIRARSAPLRRCRTGILSITTSARRSAAYA
jgi:hypothetical protein